MTGENISVYFGREQADWLLEQENRSAILQEALAEWRDRHEQSDGEPESDPEVGADA